MKILQVATMILASSASGIFIVAVAIIVAQLRSILDEIERGVKETYH